MQIAQGKREACTAVANVALVVGANAGLGRDVNHNCTRFWS